MSFKGMFAVTKPSTCSKAHAPSSGFGLSSKVITVQVHPIATIEDAYTFGGILTDDGQLPFELPVYEGKVGFLAVPREVPLNCTDTFTSPLPRFVEPVLIGSAPFTAVSGSNAYEATFSLTSAMGMQSRARSLSLGRPYHVVANVTSNDVLHL